MRPDDAISWSRFDDAYPLHDKVLRAGPEAGWFNIVATMWASRNRTDGYIKPFHLRIIASEAQFQGDVEALAATLCEVGLWETAEDGYVIHNFLNGWHTSAAEIAAKSTHYKTRKAKNQADFRERQKAANGSRNRSRNRPVTLDVDVDTEKKEETNVSSRAAGKPSRSRKPPWREIIATHPLYDACVAAFGEPPNDAVAGKWADGLKLLIQSQATPELITEHMANYRTMYASGVKGWLLENPNALALHWTDTASVTAPPGNSRAASNGYHPPSSTPATPLTADDVSPFAAARAAQASR